MTSAFTFATSIRSTCATHSVALAYLFGSQARGSADGESDVDVAVLLTKELSREERHRKRLELAVKFSRVLRVPLEKLEIVLLQEVPTLLQYNVVRHGVLLFQHDIATRKAFELSVERRYEDEHFQRERDTEVTLHRILATRV